MGGRTLEGPTGRCRDTASRGKAAQERWRLCPLGCDLGSGASTNEKEEMARTRQDPHGEKELRGKGRKGLSGVSSE